MLLAVKYCYVFTFLKTFKYEFVDCKQNKSKFVFSFRSILYRPHYLLSPSSNLIAQKRFICSLLQLFGRPLQWQSSNHDCFLHMQLHARLTVSALSYMSQFKHDSTTVIYLFAILLYTFVPVSTNNCSVDLCNGDLQTTIVFFTRNFTQGWLNSYYSLPALFCPFIRANN